MKQQPELADVLDTHYELDPRVGDVVTIASNFELCFITGEVTGIERHHAHRGYDPENEYEIVIYQELNIKIAGIDEWFSLGDDEDLEGWHLKETYRGKEFHKLGPDTVLRQKVDELLDEAIDEDEE